MRQDFAALGLLGKAKKHDMNKFFGQFLVDSQQITSDQLLHALVHQLKSAPSTAEALFEHDLLAKADQLKILAHQQIHGLDYRSSAQELGLWNVALADQVSSIIQQARRPLGEVLVSLGYLNSDVLTKTLDSYVEALSGETKSISSPPEEKSLLNEQCSQSVTGSNDLDPTLCAEFAENLNTKIIPALKALVLDAHLSTREEVDKFLRIAVSEISALRAAATFVSASQSLQLATDLISTFNTLRRSDTIPPQHDLIDMIKFSTHVFDSLGQLIGNFHSENDFSSDVNLNDLNERVSALQDRLRNHAAGNKVA